MESMEERDEIGIWEVWKLLNGTLSALAKYPSPLSGTLQLTHTRKSNTIQDIHPPILLHTLVTNTLYVSHTHTHTHKVITHTPPTNTHINKCW
jgi:hypothetical protein